MRREEDLDLDRRDDVDDMPESHASTGGAMAAGAVTGGAIGMVGGPVGAAVGAIGGAIVGALTERVMHGGGDPDHVEGDESHYADDHDHSGLDDGHDHTFHYNEYATGARMERDDRELAARERPGYQATGAAMNTDRQPADAVRLHEEELAVRKERV